MKNYKLLRWRLAGKRFFALLLVMAFSLNSLGAAGLADELAQKLVMLRGSFKADVSYTINDTLVYSGKLHYQSGSKLHLQLSNGNVIATNGQYLWLYDAASKICARQDVEADPNPFLSWLAFYQARQENNDYVFTSASAFYREVRIGVEENRLKSVTLQAVDRKIVLVLSNIEENIGISGTIFTYRPPPAAQLLENPFNKVEISGLRSVNKK